MYLALDRRILKDDCALFSIAGLATATVGYLAKAAASALIAQPSSEEIAEAFGILRYAADLYMKPEPVEGFVFMLVVFFGCVAVATAAYVSSKRLVLPVSLSLTANALFLALCGLWLLKLDLNSFFPNQLSLPISAAAAQPSILATAFLTALFAFIISRYRIFTALVAASAVVLVISSFTVFDADDGYLITSHYEVFSYSIFQDWAGRAPLIDGQKSQYGLYSLFLRPLWSVAGGPSTLQISFTMSALTVCANLVLIVFLMRFCGHKMTGISFGLLAAVAPPLIYPFWPGDAYFEFFPLRFVIPSIAMILMMLRQRRQQNDLIAYTVMSFGIFWNIESTVASVALYATFCIVLDSDIITEYPRRFATHLIKFLGCSVLAAAILSAYYHVRFGLLPDFGGLLDSVLAFSSGMGAEPMPDWGVWGVHSLVYGASLFLGLRASFTTGPSKWGAALCALSVYGLVWLKYYQGRSLAPYVRNGASDHVPGTTG